MAGKWIRCGDGLAVGSSRKMSRVTSGLTAKRWCHSRNQKLLEQETLVLFVCFFGGLKNGRCFRRRIGGAIEISNGLMGMGLRSIWKPVSHVGQYRWWQWTQWAMGEAFQRQRTTGNHGSLCTEPWGKLTFEGQGDKEGPERKS